MREIKQLLMIGCLSFAFWGVMYPQFSLVKESYVCVEKEKQADPEEDFWAILNAEYGQIKVKSKIWEKWKEVSGETKNECKQSRMERTYCYGREESKKSANRRF